MFILSSGNGWGPGDGCVQLAELIVRFVKVKCKESHSTRFYKQDDRQGRKWHRHEPLLSFLSQNSLLWEREKKVPLHFVFLMPLGFSPAGFYSLLLASQIRRTLAYFKFPRIQQPLINRKIDVLACYQKMEMERWGGLRPSSLWMHWSYIRWGEDVCKSKSVCSVANSWLPT